MQVKYIHLLLLTCPFKHHLDSLLNNSFMVSLILSRRQKFFSHKKKNLKQKQFNEGFLN